jgi:hypothetical protein
MFEMRELGNSSKCLSKVIKLGGVGVFVGCPSKPLSRVTKLGGVGVFAVS